MSGLINDEQKTVLANIKSPLSNDSGISSLASLQDDSLSPQPSSSTKHHHQPNMSYHQSDETYELSDDLKDKGWRKCYSKRETRYYYFNKNTSESIWNLKDLLHRDSLRDPLGMMTPLSATSMQSPLSAQSIHNRFAPDQMSVAASLTPQSDCSGFYHLNSTSSSSCRRASSIDSDEYGFTSPKRFQSNKNNWNLRIESNIITHERSMSLILPPNPVIELIKAELQLKYAKQLTNTLVENFNFTCENDDEGEAACATQPPLLTNSLLNEFNIYEIFSVEYSSQFQRDFIDLNIESGDGDFILNSHLFKFLVKLMSVNLNEKFSKIKKITIDDHQHDYSLIKQQMLNKCISLYKTSIMNFNIDATTQLFDKEITQWLKWCKYNDLKPTSSSCDSKSVRPTDDTSFLDYLNSLKKKCESYVYDGLKLKLTKIFNELNSTSKNYKAEISSEYKLIYEEKNIKIFNTAPEARPNRRVLCYPILICTPSPLLPLPEYYHDRSDGFTYITYKTDCLSIKTDYFVKLEHLYKASCKDDETKLNLFLARVWCLLKRYQKYYETDTTSNQIVHDERFVDDKNLFNYYFYTLNTNVLDCLSSLFYVTFEIFSNPFSCYYKQYCSLYDDTDGYFGSRGLFLNFKTIGGSSLALLPPSMAILNKYLKYMTTLIEDTSEPLSFIIVVPLVKTDKLIVDKITNNKYCKQFFKLPKSTVELRKFNEFKLSNSNDAIFKCDYEMLFAFVQNKEAEFKWPINEHDVDQLKYELQKDTINVLNYSP